MNDKIAAADVITRYANQLRPFFAVADDLRRVGSLEQAETEAKGRAQSAKKEAEAAQAHLDEIKEEETRARSDAKKILAEAKAEAEKDAEATRAAAKKDAESIIASANGEVDKARTAQSAIQVKIREYEKTLAELGSKIEAKQRSLDDLERGRQALLAKIA